MTNQPSESQDVNRTSGANAAQAVKKWTRPQVEDPALDERGAEVHPAFGMIGASRVSSSPPGATLFDSEVQHGHYVVLRIRRATRTRDLHRDWIHESGGEIVEVAMSEAQWAGMISSMNTGGTPCTILRTEQDGFMARLPYEPRLAMSRREAVGAAERVFGSIREARDAYEEKKTAANLRALHFAIENATSSVDFATKSLSEHTEDVVQHARADIEAMLSARARELGIDPTASAQVAAIEGQ